MGILIAVVFSFAIAYADYAYRRRCRRRAQERWQERGRSHNQTSKK